MHAKDIMVHKILCMHMYMYLMHTFVHTHTYTQCKTTPLSLTYSLNGKLFAVMAKDRKVRVFTFLTGKLHRVFDEALDIFTEQQQVS